MAVEIIAEVGSNHNGDFNTACALIHAAKDAGADTVKFQHYPDERYGPHPMPKRWLFPLQNHCYANGLDFLCSVFDKRTLLEYVNECVPTRVKIASPELTHHDLLKLCVFHGVEVILSTGMSTMSQVLDAVEVVYGAGAPSMTLMHCLSSYPAPPEEMNLLAMKRLVPYGRLGLSDHSLDPVAAPVAATVLGAEVIEKHFTLDRDAEGPDHSYALDPKGFRVMVEAVRTASVMLGDGVKRVMPSEDPLARRTEEWMAA